MSKTLTILGSTGSVGKNTFEVALANTHDFDIYALTAHKNVALLAQQAKQSCAKLAVIGDDSLYIELKNQLSGTDIECAAGKQAIIDASSISVDIAIAAIVGMAGLKPILSALRNGKNVAIANKEPLVAAGALVMQTAQKHGAAILPVDSEHNAIFQCLENCNKDFVRRLVLTASGGPFRTWDEAKMKAATKEQALAHPNWTMGAKISIDSATMMNKALEVIEAHYLFDMPANKIDVLVHPQSVIHSMVEYEDGSVLAQMGVSDMKVPISHALGWPKRLKKGGDKIDFVTLSNLSFEPVDHRRFPAINLGYKCLEEGPSALIAMNAANEVAVDAFLNNKIGFMDITRIVKQTVESSTQLFDNTNAHDIDGIVAFDHKMRQFTQSYIIKEITNN